MLTILESGIASFSIFTMYDSLGMLRLLGLPHVILWSPLAIYLFKLSRKAEMPQIPVWVLRIVYATIVISLIFDYRDVIRYILGDRALLI